MRKQGYQGKNIKIMKVGNRKQIRGNGADYAKGWTVTF